MTTKRLGSQRGLLEVSQHGEKKPWSSGLPRRPELEGPRLQRDRKPPEASPTFSEAFGTMPFLSIERYNKVESKRTKKVIAYKHQPKESWCSYNNSKQSRLKGKKHYKR